MLEIYTIYGGGMWKTALDAVVTLLGMNTFSTLLRIAGTFGVLAALFAFIKQRKPDGDGAVAGHLHGPDVCPAGSKTFRADYRPVRPGSGLENR